MDCLSEELKSIEENERTRSAFLEKVLKKLAAVSTERDALQKKLRSTEYTCGKYQDDLQSKEVEISGLQKQMDREPFVLVLIDGDISPFVDEYIQRGVSGGNHAARNLRNAVLNYVEKLEAYQAHWKITIRIYAKIRGLGNIYEKAGITNNHNALREFVEGFNNENNLCDFVDAGDDKEGADNKVEKVLGMFYNNVHCKHILLGSSGDKGYVNLLRQYVPMEGSCKRLTLLETLPFPHDFKELVPNFETTQFEGLFRTSKIPSRRASFRDEKHVSPPTSLSPATTYASTVNQTPSTNGTRCVTEGEYGGVVREPKDTKKGFPLHSDSSTSLAAPPSATASPQQQHQSDPQPDKIRRNRAGHRVDPTIRYDKDVCARLKSLKLCNRHFLTHCAYTDCTHAHDYRGHMGAVELNALRYIARMSPCVSSVWCRDPNCVAGHRCIQDPNCNWNSNCRFRPEMHNIDTKIVEAIVV